MDRVSQRCPYYPATKLTDQDTSNGLRSVRAVAKRLKLDGVFGPLYDLFEVSDRYKQAVEITAGTRSAGRSATSE